MIKILILVAMVVLGLIGTVKTITRRCYPGDNIELMGFIFVVSAILLIAGCACLGIAFASY